MLPTEIKLCCKMLGTAMTPMRRSMAQEKRGAFSAGRPARRRRTASMASAQLTPWQRKVAQATPATPM